VGSGFEVYLNLHRATKKSCGYQKEKVMSSEFVVVIVLVVLAIAGLVFLERHSRQNKQNNDQE